MGDIRPWRGLRPFWLTPYDSGMGSETLARVYVGLGFSDS